MAERVVPHRRQDAIDDQQLELPLAREARPVSERLRVMSEGRDPGAAAVIVLAPAGRL